MSEKRDEKEQKRVKLHKALTYEQSIQLEAFALSGMPFELAANHLKLTAKQLRLRITDNPEVEASYKKAKQKAVRTIAATLFNKAVAGDTTAMIFYLKTQGKWRENHEEEQQSLPELTGKTFEELYTLRFGHPPTAEVLAALKKSKQVAGSVTITIPVSSSKKRPD